MQDSNLNQDHKGEGDNVGRDKIVTYNTLPTDENRSELDVFNDYLATASLNQTATTSQPIAGKTVDDLDAKEVRRFLALPLVKDHFAKHKIPKNAPLAEKLRALSLMTNGYVVKGTFFCLANVTKLGVFGGNLAYSSFGVFSTLDKTVVRKSEHVYGNLIQQYEEMHDLIIKELSPMEIINWNPRVLDYSIPQDVFRELLANAYIHRSYEHDTPYRIMIEVYPDRLVIKNAGNFPDNIDFNDLKNMDSVQRNPEIARLFFLHDVVELQGSGIARVQSILKERGFQPAVFQQRNGLVEVTIYKNKSIDELKEEYNNAIYNGNNEKALEIVKALIVLSEKQFGTEHSNTAISYNNIGELYRMQGDYTAALEYHKKAVAIREKLLGAEHPDTANSYNNIGLLYYSIGNYDTALVFYKKAVAIHEKVFGTEHPSIAISYNNIANTHYAQGDYTTALNYYQKALTILKKALPFGHPTTKTGLNNYRTALDEAKETLPPATILAHFIFIKSNFSEYL